MQDIADDSGKPRQPDARSSAGLVTPFLAALTILTIAIFIWNESRAGMLDRYERIRGRDFLQFYLAGKIVADGHVDRLYDQDYFFDQQTRMSPVNDRNPRYYSLYPPTIGWMFSPLARQSYDVAIVAWWLIQIGLFAVSVALLIRELPGSTNRTSHCWIAAAAFLPVGSALINGQLAPILLLAVVVGFRCRGAGRPILGGLALSLLFIKPQFAAGLAIWCVLRGHWKIVIGMFIGAALQAGVIYLSLGEEPLVAYAKNLRVYMELSGIYRFSADYQHSLSGILINLFGRDFRDWAKLPHLLLAIAAGILVLRLPRPVYRLKPTSTSDAAADPTAALPSLTDAWPEQSTAILFMLLFTPHLLIYDLSLLLAPIAWLLATSLPAPTKSPRPLALTLYIAGMLPPVYLLLRASFTPFILIWTLWQIAKCSRGSDNLANNSNRTM